MKYIAHIAEDGRGQSVEAHLLGTAKLAKQFAESFGAGSDAAFAGLLHDIGKCTAGFQARLHGGARVDHATAGAKAAFQKGNLPAAFAVAGHHGGLPDGGNHRDEPEEATLCGRVRRDGSFDASVLGQLPPPPEEPPSWLGRDLLQNAFYTRMLYSCLVDADFQDTQNFMDGKMAPRGAHASIRNLLDLVRERADSYLAAAAQTPGFRAPQCGPACLHGAWKGVAERPLYVDSADRRRKDVFLPDLRVGAGERAANGPRNLCHTLYLHH